MKRLAYATQEEKKAHYEAWPLDAPLKGWAPIDQDDFLRRLFHNPYTLVEERWMRLEQNRPVRVMLWFEPSGDNVAATLLDGFFEFGCHHEYTHVKNLGRCYNRYQCTKCGRTMDVDSGD